MAFDPTQPALGAPLDPAQMRNQLNALKALIDAQQTQISSQQTIIGALQAQLALTLAMNGNNFSWSWYGPNPANWRLWKIPSALNPTTANFQAWRNQSSDNNEVDGDVRTVSWEADSGYCYALCAYDDVNDVALAPASNVIAVQ